MATATKNRGDHLSTTPDERLARIEARVEALVADVIELKRSLYVGDGEREALLTTAQRTKDEVRAVKERLGGLAADLKTKELRHFDNEIVRRREQTKVIAAAVTAAVAALGGVAAQIVTRL